MIIKKVILALLFAVLVLSIFVYIIYKNINYFNGSKSKFNPDKAEKTFRKFAIAEITIGIYLIIISFIGFYMIVSSLYNNYKSMLDDYYEIVEFFISPVILYLGIRIFYSGKKGITKNT